MVVYTTTFQILEELSYENQFCKCRVARVVNKTLSYFTNHTCNNVNEYFTLSNRQLSIEPILNKQCILGPKHTFACNLKPAKSELAGFAQC